MWMIPHDFSEEYDELQRRVDELRLTCIVAAKDLRQMAGELHTMDHEDIYENLLDVARELERSVGG